MRSMYLNGRRQWATTGGGFFSTDEAGAYRIVGLTPGTYVVMAWLRDLWTVAVARQMRQKHVLEPVGVDFTDQGRGGIVAEVAVPAHDALFQRPGTRGVFLQ